MTSELNLLDCFRGKKIIVTGHTGFKGSWLTAWLNELGANVIGISFNIPTNPSHFELLNLEDIEDYKIDIRDPFALENLLKIKSPDFVFHLAAQSLVINSYKKPLETWNTNLMGTVNLLEALRSLNNECTAILITSDKFFILKCLVKPYSEANKVL